MAKPKKSFLSLSSQCWLGEESIAWCTGTIVDVGTAQDDSCPGNGAFDSRLVVSRWLRLLAPLDCLDSHLHEPVLGLALREFADALDSLFRVIFSQRPRLLDTVRLQDDLSRLIFHAVSKNPRPISCYSRKAKA